MTIDRRAVRTFAPAILFLLLATALPGPGSAQLPEVPGVTENEAFNFQMTPDRGAVYVPFLRNGLVNITIEDRSSPRTGGTVVNPIASQILLEAHVVGNRTDGWLASMEAGAVFMRPSEIRVITLNVQVGATVVEPVVAVEVNAVQVAPNGHRTVRNMSILAVAQSTPFVNLQMVGVQDAFRPDEQRRVPILVRNDNYYPDMVDFRVRAVEGWVVSPPSTLTLAPGEQRQVFFDIKAPDDPWFYLFPTSNLVLIEAHSVTDPGARYSIGVPTPISGFFVPGWVLPQFLMLLIGLMVLAPAAKRRAEEKRAERARPRRGPQTPEEEAKLAALKRSDPERHKAVSERMAILHKRRVATWKQVYGKRRKLEKEMSARERRRHDALLKEQKREQREQSRLEKRRRRAERKEKRRKARAVAAAERKKKRSKKKADKARRKEDKRVAKQKAKAEKREAEAASKAERKRAKEHARLSKAKAKELEKLEKRKAKAVKHEAKAAAQREKQVRALEKKKAKLEKKAGKQKRGRKG